PRRGIRMNRPRFAAGTPAGFLPRQFAGTRDRLRHVETQRILLAAFHAPPALVVAHRPRSAGIKRRSIRIARPRLTLGDIARDFGAALETRIDQPHRLKLFERAPIIVEMFGLPTHRLLERNAEPYEVFVNPRL